MLEYDDTDQAIRKNVDIDDKIKCSDFFMDNINHDNIKSNFDLNKEQPNTIFINYNGLKKLICKSNKIIGNELLDLFNIKEDTRYLRKETEIIKFIQLYLDELNIKYIFQYTIKTYKIDLYLPNNNLVIEIDEFNHIDRCPIYESKREIYIKKKLNCNFLRINPDCNNFTLAKCIAMITKYLYM